MTQLGLAQIAPIFNRHGWYWGAGFGREDAMHFEVGDERIRAWHQEGKLIGRAPVLDDGVVGFGDRGPEVAELQRQLVAQGYPLEVDGEFGAITRAAVLAFQAKYALKPTGVLDAATGEFLRNPDQSMLHWGHKGTDVAKWQAFLVAQGFREVGNVDGEFGPKTNRATMAFQAAHSLEETGVVSPSTVAEAEKLGFDSKSGAPPIRTLRRMTNSELTKDICAQAAKLLRQHYNDPIGTEIPFFSGGKAYVGVLEWHFNTEKGKHKGLSTFDPEP
ncbi:MAG: peptidoglycan-binding protein [Polyangiaceae bacterium]